MKKTAKAKETIPTGEKENCLTIGEISLSSKNLEMADLVEAMIFLLEDCKPVKDYLAELGRRGALKQVRLNEDYIG